MTGKFEKKSITKAICAIITLTLTILLCFAACEEPRTVDTFDTSLLPDFAYELNEDKNGVKDIPFDEYLQSVEIPQDGAVVYASDKGADENADGVANAKAINAAIDELSKAGGGSFVIDGKYKTSTVELKSGVSLYIQQDCALISLTYDENKSASTKLSNGLVTAYGAENIGIYGPGRLMGEGETFTEEPVDSTPLMPLEKFNLKERVLASRDRIRMEKENSGRVNLLYLSDCSGVTLTGVEFYHSATWTCNIRDCDNVNIKDCVINNNIYVANSDGFDIVSSQDVNISHCFIATADDGIVIKANSAEEVKNVTVKDCKIMSLANCFKIGTETSKDVSNITVDNCDFFMAGGIVGGCSGIALESADGSDVSNVKISNIRMDGVTSPLLIWLGNRLDEKNGSDGKTVGSMKDIEISNVYCDNVELPSAIVGVKTRTETYYVNNVKISDFYVRYRDTGENLDVAVPTLEANMNGYPEITRVSHQYIFTHETSKYYDLPVYGLFLRYTDGLQLTNFKVIPRSCTTLDKWNISGDLAVDSKNITVR